MTNIAVFLYDEMHLKGYPNRVLKVLLEDLTTIILLLISAAIVIMVTLSEILGQRFLDQNTLTEGNYAYCIHTDTSTLGITITEMQKLFCHKIENVSISRFCV